MKNRDDLWVKALLTKYKSKNDLIPTIKKNQSCSNTWKGIWSVWSNIEKEIYWNVGRGDKVLFWNDDWIRGVGKLKDWAISNVDDMKDHEKVAEYVAENGEWDRGRIMDCLPRHICDKIFAMYPSGRHRREDGIAWKWSNDGCFSITSAYDIRAEIWGFISGMEVANERGFSKIWMEMDSRAALDLM
ncbi:putative ribonuclease H protein At1g65750 family [Senna tora]|uniref:Putative ribonuclease H protein At1g65750 family n=1 Tax=Senna tora TaxID=362788 RepID=A0A834SQ64_9FABA|nr:putative ribonuclease H protein At1g65750 family [Senna tora]